MKNVERVFILALFLAACTVVAAVMFRSKALAKLHPRPTRRVLLLPSADIREHSSFVAGDPKAPFQIVEFMDYECGPCRQVDGSLSSFVANHSSKVGWSVRNFPLSFHSHAYAAAAASLAAERMGTFNAFRDLMVHSDKTLDDETLESFAWEVGVSPKAFKKACTDTKVEVDRDLRMAAKLELSGTPSLILLSADGSATLFSSLDDLENAVKG